MAATKTTVLKALRENVHADTIGRDKDGNIVLRWEFFYTHGCTSEKKAEMVQKFLADQKLPATVVDHGEHYAAFRGGASTRNSSHWWVKVEEV